MPDNSSSAATSSASRVESEGPLALTIGVMGGAGEGRRGQACEKTSVDEALRQELELDGIAELEREWNTWAQSSRGLDLVELWPPFDRPAVVASLR